jgi:hypothetical protein
MECLVRTGNPSAWIARVWIALRMDSPSAVRTGARGVEWWPVKPGQYTGGRQLLMIFFKYMVFMAPSGV